MLPDAWERLVPVPGEGNAPALITLHRIADMIRAPDALVDAVVDTMSARWEAASPAELARQVFEWTRSHVAYLPDWHDDTILEELHTPGYMLHEIGRLGATVGDCDDSVGLLGALYHRLGFPVTLIAISRWEDQLLDHVYLAVTVGGERINADPIVAEPFGWEVPEAEQTHRVELEV